MCVKLSALDNSASNIATIVGFGTKEFYELFGIFHVIHN